MGTLAAYSVAGGAGKNSVAFAQQPPVAVQSQSSSLPATRFNIPPGFLDQVIPSFTKATGLQVNLANTDIGSLRSPGITGLFTPEQAMTRLLAGSGVQARFDSTGAVTLELAGPNISVDVIGQPAPLSVKYPEPLRDTPQTITVITKNLIEQQGATTLRDVLRNVPGLTMAAGEGGTPAGDNLTLRGFSARNDLFVDGVRDLGPQSRDPFNLEQVEVVKGPQSTFTGRGSTGGSINMVSKAPEPRRFLTLTGNFGTDPLTRGVVDFNVPLKVLGRGAAFRGNLMAHHAGVPGRDQVENNRWGVAPALSFGAGSPTRLTLSYFKLKQDNLSDYGIPWVPDTNNVLVDYRNKPAPVPRETFYGFKNRDFERMGTDTGTVKIERDLGESTTLRSQFRYGRSTRDSIATPPRFASPDSTVINREMRSWITEDEVWDNQTDLRTSFHTGAIEHSVVTGLSLTREGNIRRLRSAANAQTTLLNPNPFDTYTGDITVSPYVGDITGDTQAGYLFDNVKFGRHWEATGGFRLERFAVDGVSAGNSGATPVSHTDTMRSVRASLVYKPADAGSLYASYGTSLNPSLEGLSYQTGPADLEPEKTYTLETGAKWDLAAGRLGLSTAFFRVEKTNARTPGLLPDDPPQVLQGRQRAQGLELGVTGSITPRWQVFGAYTYLHARVVESNNPAEVGNYVALAPDQSMNFWSTYQFNRFTIGGGPRYVGRRYNNTSNTRSVDGYWTVDALASVRVHRQVDLRFNLYNLTDEYYFDRVGGGHVVPGPARSAMVSTSFRF